MSYSFQYTIIVPTTSNTNTGGNFEFTTSQSPTGGPYAITGVTGSFDGSLITGFGAGEALGFGPNFYDGISSSNPGIVLTTADGESVQITDEGNNLFVQASGPTQVSSFTTGLAFSDNVPACFLRGTRIMTGAGEVPVESLAIGDMLVTASGALRPIKWIGRRSYSGRLAAATASLQPVRIRAGALGNGLPWRDLLVSAKHAMMVDGCLVAAEDLIDGHSVVRERGLAEINYVHVEFEAHDVVLAEGAWSETFVDDNSRAIFQNAEDYAARYPDETPRPALYCAPRVTDGFVLDAIRARLAGDVRLAA